MRFEPGIKIGETVSNRRLAEIFECGNTGGMRPSNKTNTLVLIADHTKRLYSDKWMDDILYYTGTGKNGHQSLSGNPGYKNGMIYDSSRSDRVLHLFEVLAKNSYTYKGVVKLATNPYMEEQIDEDGKNRSVWIFPLKIVDESFEMEVVAKERKEDLLQEETLKEELNRIDKADIPRTFSFLCKPKERVPPMIINCVSVYKRDRNTAIRALCAAKYLCEIDWRHPTFKRRKLDINYTEPHHLVPMKFSEEFPVSLDVEENIVSLCSNCHNQLHYGSNYQGLLKTLYEERKELLKLVGICITYGRLEEMYEE